MSPDTDRIAVPTNGKGPHPAPPPSAAATRPVAPEPPAGPSATFTPTQLVVGFGILAAIIALLARSLRQWSRGGRGGPFGRR